MTKDAIKHSVAIKLMAHKMVEIWTSINIESVEIALEDHMDWKGN